MSSTFVPDCSFAILGTTEPDFYCGSATGIPPEKPSHNQRIAEWKIVLLCKLIPEAKSVTGKLFFRSVTLRPQ